MSNISQIKSQGTGIKLDNIEVVSDYGLKTGATNHRALLVKDLSDQTIVKIWGPASGTAWPTGSIITITASGKGEIKTNEWPQGSGKISLNCNECNVEGDGGVADSTPSPSKPKPPTDYREPTQEHAQVKLSQAELIQKQHQIFAEHCKVGYAIAKDNGGSPDDVLQAAAIMTGAVGEFWHGAKYPV